MDYKEKYLKYKNKYIKLKNQTGGIGYLLQDPRFNIPYYNQSINDEGKIIFLANIYKALKEANIKEKKPEKKLELTPIEIEWYNSSATDIVLVEKTEMYGGTYNISKKLINSKKNSLKIHKQPNKLIYNQNKQQYNLYGGEYMEAIIDQFMIGCGLIDDRKQPFLLAANQDKRFKDKVYYDRSHHISDVIGFLQEIQHGDNAKKEDLYEILSCLLYTIGFATIYRKSYYILVSDYNKNINTDLNQYSRYFKYFNKYLTSYITKYKYRTTNVVLWRGQGSDYDAILSDPDSMNKKKYWESQGFFSTTTNFDRSRVFAQLDIPNKKNKIIYKIINYGYEGQESLFVGSDVPHSLTAENEILIYPNIIFQVNNITRYIKGIHGISHLNNRNILTLNWNIEFTTGENVFDNWISQDNISIIMHPDVLTELRQFIGRENKSAEINHILHEEILSQHKQGVNSLHENLKKFAIDTNLCELYYAVVELSIVDIHKVSLTEAMAM